MVRFLRFVDRTNEWVGGSVKWFIVILTAILCFEVIMRYLFNSPTKWAYDISYMLGGSFFVLGMGYTLKLDKHVRVDVFSSKFPVKTKAVIDVALSLLVFFPTFLLFLINLIPNVYLSWMTNERSLESFWRPPIYPVKTTLLIGVILLLLQGVVVFIGNLRVILDKERI
jgi:TRAP-type mannitol/chloroaromatic compound transport system permease small subunit